MQPLELAALPLDAARRSTLRLATRSAWLTRVLARRNSRVACLATLQVFLLFLLTLRAPVALFFVGPVLLGVVHLAADVRYLVLHRAPPRGLLVASLAIAIALTVVRVLASAHLVSARGADTADVVLGTAWIGLALVFAFAGDVRRLLLVGPLFVGVATFLVHHARLVELTLIHLHNVVALVAWLVLFRRRPGWAVVPLAGVVALAAMLLSGASLPWTFDHGGATAFGVSLGGLAAWVAPGVNPRTGVALAVTFVFLQGVHYAAWTGWIPQDDLPGEGTPTFRMSARSLLADFGAVGLGLVVVAAVAVAGAAAWDLPMAGSGYMTLAKSHGWFELAFLLYFVAKRR